MIDRNAMALFVKVVENHSFSKTAQRENVPVSTVSRKISVLEKAIGKANLAIAVDVALLVCACLTKVVRER